MLAERTDDTTELVECISGFGLQEPVRIGSRLRNTGMAAFAKSLSYTASPLTTMVSVIPAKRLYGHANARRSPEIRHTPCDESAPIASCLAQAQPPTDTPDDQS